uniref:Uncharacterized protein n=1 Tax=Paracalanus parvus TaxID=187406 RepID=A0A0U2VA82_9MAXI|nr:hypothetical protein [Paracalanus parvus]
MSQVEKEAHEEAQEEEEEDEVQVQVDPSIIIPKPQRRFNLL